MKYSKLYPTTDVGADGQIVKVPFSDMIYFEVLPAFGNLDGTYMHPDSNNGGSWEHTNPNAEIKAVVTGQAFTNGNLINLCRMMRAWKYHQSVPMGGLLLDTFAYNFLTNWQYKGESFLYYDFMTRDFFDYLRKINPYLTSWHAVGSNALLQKSGDFISKASKAYNYALEALKFENDNMPISADAKWKEIFGTRFTI